MILLPTAVLADVPILFVFAGVRVVFWWTILVAIAVEAVALWRFFGLSLRRAVVAAVVVNIGTALMGFVVYPLVGMMSYPVLAPLVTNVFGTGRIVEVAAYCIAAAVVDTPIELGLLVLLSAVAGYGVKIGRKAAAVFFLANLISAAVLFVAIEIGPRRVPVDAAMQDLIATEFADEVAFINAVFRALPDHVDEDGKVDPAWREGLRQEAEGMAFVELMVGSNKAQYAVVKMPMPGIGRGYMFEYEEARYDGDAKITRGTMRPHGTSGDAQDAVMRVVHYHIYGNGAEPVRAVRAILRLPDR